MISTEQRAGPGKRETHMVAGMTGGVKTLNFTISDCQTLAVYQTHVRGELSVDAFFSCDCTGLCFCAMRAKGKGRRTTGSLKLSGPW